MRRIRFYLLTLLAIAWLLVLLSYFIVQTAFGAKFVSEQLSKLSPYTISIGHVHHSFSNVYEVVLDDVVISDGQQQIANIPKMVIGLDKHELWQFNHFSYVTVIDGILADSKIKHYDFSTDTLKFINSTITVSINNNEDKILFKQVNGGIKSYSSSSLNNAQFDFTSNEVLINEVAIKSVIVQGFHRDNITYLTNLGGNIENGFFVSKLKILADKSWDIEQLKLSNIHLQSQTDDFWEKYISYLPKFSLRQLSIFESSIQLPSFLVEKGNLEVKNICFDNGWYFDESSLVFNADNVVWLDNLFSSVLLQLNLNDNNIEIEKAIATWNKGNVNLTGSWHDSTLQLEQVTIASVIYQLPQHLEQLVLPTQFSRIEITQLSILPSLLINVDANYPFAFTNFEALGSDIVIVKDKYLGFDAGNLFFKAERGSIIGIEINYPDLTLKYDSQQHALLNFSSLINKGVVEIKAKLNANQTEFTSFQLGAANIPSSLLKDWKLVNYDPESTNYTVNLVGKIAPFSLAGTIQVNAINHFLQSDN
ncbi:hypothetical protein [Gilliamella sp. CG16]|uniref:hypothetical protein n=1 Tax=Gilliamella sp. CG16 TaxID=3351503 RepID=UPI00398806B1